MIPTFVPNFDSRKLIYALDMPSFQRDFAGEKTLDRGTGPAITFTRASGGTYFDANGVLQTATNDIPRFDHNPDTGNASRGLLIEESRTNLHRRSQDFSQGWVTNSANSSVTVDATQTGLDGTLSVGAFTCANTDSAARRLFANANITTVSGTEYTFSVYLKSINSWPIALLQCSQGSGVTTSSGTARYDLINGTIVGSGTGASQIQSVGNGWYRCSVTTTGNTITSMRPKIILIANSGDGASTGVTGVVGSGVYVWGAQLEAGLFSTSYIPTTSASVTRAADIAIIAPVSGFFDANEGTIHTTFRTRTVSGIRTILSLDNDTSDEQIRLLTDTTNPKLFITDGGSTQAEIDAGTVAASTTYSFASAYQADDFAASIGGGSAVTDTSGTLPSVTHLRFGTDKAGNAFNGFIAKIAYWPKRLSDALLAQLTT